MELALDAGAGQYPAFQGLVSILVFVELALDDGWHHSEESREKMRFPMENQKKSNARG